MLTHYKLAFFSMWYYESMISNLPFQGKTKKRNVFERVILAFRKYQALRRIRQAERNYEKGNSQILDIDELFREIEEEIN